MVHRAGVSPREWPPYRPDATTTLLLPSASSFVSDLGLASREALLRQLAVDLPRSVVRVDGARTTCPWRVARTARYPALCTQAALAPPCEWMLLHGYVACEPRRDRAAMEVDVWARGGGVCARKRLLVRSWEETVEGREEGRGESREEEEGRTLPGGREVVVEVTTGSIREENGLLVTIVPLW